MHHKDGNDAMNGKPEMISLYNSTKGGVDLLDMKCSNYCANQRTRRWPLAIFYHVIAVSCCNAHILHQHTNETQKSRFDFMNALAMALIKPQLQKRFEIPNLNQELRDIIEKTLSGMPQETRRRNEQPRQEQPPPRKSDKLEKRATCRYCPYKKERTTRYKCIKCEKPNCLECSKTLCNVYVDEVCK